jgi:hypothetical protein
MPGPRSGRANGRGVVQSARVAAVMGSVWRARARPTAAAGPAAALIRVVADAAAHGASLSASAGAPPRDHPCSDQWPARFRPTPGRCCAPSPRCSRGEWRGAASAWLPLCWLRQVVLLQISWGTRGG